MMRRSITTLVLAVLVVACGSPVSNASNQLIEQVRLGDPLAQQTYNENRELIESEEAFPIWLDALQNDESPQVKAWAAQILGNMGNPEALPALGAAMSEQREVRDAAVAAIRQFDEAEAARTFMGVLGDGTRDAKAIALAQISRVGGTDAVESVKAVAMGDDALLADTATNTLGDIATPEAASALADVALDTSQPQNIRASAIANLGRIEGADAEIERVAAGLAEEEGADELRSRVDQLR